MKAKPNAVGSIYHFGSHAARPEKASGARKEKAMRSANEIAVEERIAQLETTVQRLIENDRIHQENQKELHAAVSVEYPRIVGVQDAAIATLATDQKSLLELVKARDRVVELLAEAVKHHAEAIDRLENLLGLQGKVPAN